MHMAVEARRRRFFRRRRFLVEAFGTSDLTASMGIAGQIGHPDVRAAHAAMARARLAHDKVPGMGGMCGGMWLRAHVVPGAQLHPPGVRTMPRCRHAPRGRAGFLNGLSP